MSKEDEFLKEIRNSLAEQVKKEMEDLAKHIQYIELGSSDNYERLFAKCLLF